MRRARPGDGPPCPIGRCHASRSCHQLGPTGRGAFGRAGPAAALLAALASRAWPRAAVADTNASNASSVATCAAASAARAPSSARSASWKDAAHAARAMVSGSAPRLLLRLRLPRGGPRGRTSATVPSTCSRGANKHAVPVVLRQHVSVMPAKGSKVVQTVQVRHESSVSPPKRFANQSSKSLAILADVRGARSRLEPEQAADSARCCDAGGGDDQNTLLTRTRQRWRGAQPSICSGHA